MVSCLSRHPLVELTSIVLLIWISKIQCLIDKEKDLEGLVTDSCIDTHEIPLKYDLFRDRVLPELLQTVPDDIMDDYINQIPEVNYTVDMRHTTIVYRHDHLYYTAPHDLYRKLRYYKWKFRSRRRRTTPTPEPSFTLNEEDFLELRNQVNVVVTEKHEIIEDPKNPPTMWVTRNTHTGVYPAQRLHSVILKKQFFDKKVPDSYYDDQLDYAQGRATNPLLELVGMTFNTVFRTIRRLNRTVTFIPFRIGSWHTSSWYPVTTAYYMYPNYTLPTHRTLATDMYDYDIPIFPMVTSKPFAFINEEGNRKRFSLAIVERVKQRELQLAMRNINTSYLKHLMKPYKYPTVLVGPTLPSTAVPHYPGYKQWFTKEAPDIVTHSIEVLKGSKNHTVKMMKMDFDIEDDLFDMDINDLVIQTTIKKSDLLYTATTENVHGNMDDRTTYANTYEETTNMEYLCESKTNKQLLGEIANENEDNPANAINSDINENILTDKSENIHKNEDSFNHTTDNSETLKIEIKATKKRARKSKRTTKGKRKRKDNKLNELSNEDSINETEVSGNNPTNENIGDIDENIQKNEDTNNSETPQIEIKATKKRTRKSKRTTKRKRKRKDNKLSDENEESNDETEISGNDIYDDNINDNYDNINSDANENDNPNYNEDGDTKTDPDDTTLKKRGQKKVNIMSKLLNKYEKLKKPIHHVEKRSLLNTTQPYRDGSKEEVVAKTTRGTYSNFKSLLLKKLSRTKGTKKISTYTFRTRKIPILKSKMFTSGITSKKCETTNTDSYSTEKTIKLKAADHDTKKTITRKSGLTNLRSKSKTIERKETTQTTKLMKNTPQKSQTKKKAIVKTTTKQKTEEEIKGEFLLFNGDRKDPFEEMKKGKTRKKSREERQQELLHMLYPPVTLHNVKETLDNKNRYQHKDDSNQHGKLTPGKPFDESKSSEKKPKRRKKMNEEEEEFLNQIYQPVTVDEEWDREYERGLRPTFPQNMSKHDYVRGFYTYGTSDETVDTANMTTLCFKNDTNLNNQAGYFLNDTNLFTSQEKIKFQEVINMYNKYAEQFLQEAISTRKPRKKISEITTLEVNTEGAAMFEMEQKMLRNWTRPFIQCNWSNFIYY